MAVTATDPDVALDRAATRRSTCAARPLPHIPSSVDRAGCP